MTTKTIHTGSHTVLELTAHGDDIEVITRETDAYGVVAYLPLAELRATLDEIAPVKGQPRTDDCPGAQISDLARTLAAVTPCTCSAQRDRAEKAEREREQLRAEVDEMWVKARRVERVEIIAKEQAETIKEQQALIDALRADQSRLVSGYNFVATGGHVYQHVDDIKPRALDPGEVPDSMLLAMLNALSAREPGKTVGQHPALLLERLRRGISAVLAIDTTRPEGAEDLDPHVDASLRGIGLNPLSADELRTVADNLASEGVRATEVTP